MNPQIITVLIILGVAVLLFITELVRVDLVALLVLVSLALTRLVTPAEAISGFSNPAVVTVWAVLILSSALSRTGIANLIGNRLLKLVGNREAPLIGTIMLVVGLFSGFMNSIGVVSLFLPVVINIARRIKIHPSKFLMPLTLAALIGGLTTLIGTPPNIILSGALQEAGFKPFTMFDFTPVGLTILLVGIIYMVFVGRHLLPSRDIAQEFTSSPGADYTGLYNLQERMFVLRLPADSPLAGRSLTESRLGSALGLNVIAILRADDLLLAPAPEAALQAGDRLLVEGREDQLAEVLNHQQMALTDERFDLENLISAEIGLVELELVLDSPLTGSSLLEVGFRQKFGLIVLAIRRGGIVWRSNLESLSLQPGDILLAQGRRTQIDALQAFSTWFQIRSLETGVYQLEERLMLVRLHPDSLLSGRSLVESRFGDAFGMSVLGIIRDGEVTLMPEPDAILLGGDVLMVKGIQEDLLTVTDLQNLKIETQVPSIDALESKGIGLVEAILSPHTTLVDKTLEELNFRSKYGLNVMAIWREGRAYRSNLRDIPLRFGDALLLYGPLENVQLLGREPDFIVLAEKAQEPPRLEKASTAVFIMAVVLIPVILGWLNIVIAAIAGVVMMVLTGCLTMEEAYRSIQLQIIFLIAGVLPLGIALENTGAAHYLAESMIALVGPLGPLGAMAGIFILVALASQVIHNSAVAVLLAPIALNTATEMGVSPYPFMMTVAVSVSAAILSPVGHPSNLMIMGPGGYKFGDYFKVGLPLTLVLLLVVLLVLPVLWPF